jgi:cytochrome b subunit of formate dehydrogenase
MATYTDKPETNQPASAAAQASAMVRDVKGEVAHEIRHIHQAKEPVDPTQSDHVVRKHVAGLSISFFIAIALFLLIAIAGIVIYTYTHR